MVLRNILLINDLEECFNVMIMLKKSMMLIKVPHKKTEVLYTHI